MKQVTLMSVFACGLSIFLFSAQAQDSSSIGASATSGSDEAADATSDASEKKPDINEVIKSATEFTNSVGMVMKKAGSLWISAYETTQAEYQDVMESNPSAFAGKERPVDSVSWNEAITFCKKLTAHEKEEDMLPKDYVYALPTQEQWDALAQNVSLKDAVTSLSGNRTGSASVGSLAPSKDGLYDLRGNVAEWCANPSDGAYRVLRGGSWQDWIDVNLRLEFRIYEAPAVSKNTFGFRCILIQGN